MGTRPPTRENVQITEKTSHQQPNHKLHRNQFLADKDDIYCTLDSLIFCRKLK